jgi:hypothetical protein
MESVRLGDAFGPKFIDLESDGLPQSRALCPGVGGLT